jgi:hypothetical protein
MRKLLETTRSLVHELALLLQLVQQVLKLTNEDFLI